jgi:hypothetical protein
VAIGRTGTVSLLYAVVFDGGAEGLGGARGDSSSHRLLQRQLCDIGGMFEGLSEIKVRTTHTRARSGREREHPRSTAIAPCVCLASHRSVI